MAGAVFANNAGPGIGLMAVTQGRRETLTAQSAIAKPPPADLSHGTSAQGRADRPRIIARCVTLITGVQQMPGYGVCVWRASNEGVPMRRPSASVSVAPLLSVALSSPPAPEPAVRRFWPLAVIALGLALTLAWACLLGYAFVALFGFAWSQVEWSLLAF
jgi:hypothetical protein